MGGLGPSGAALREGLAELEGAGERSSGGPRGPSERAAGGPAAAAAAPAERGGDGAPSRPGTGASALFAGLQDLGVANGEDLKETLTNCTEPLKAIEQFQVGGRGEWAGFAPLALFPGRRDPGSRTRAHGRTWVEVRGALSLKPAPPGTPAQLPPVFSARPGPDQTWPPLCFPLLPRVSRIDPALTTLLPQTENGVLLPSLQSALPFLDLHGTPRLEFHQSVFDELREKLLERVSAIASEGKAEERWAAGGSAALSQEGTARSSTYCPPGYASPSEKGLSPLAPACGRSCPQPPGSCAASQSPASPQVQEAGRPAGEELFPGEDAVAAAGGDVRHETLAQGESQAVRTAAWPGRVPEPL